MRQGLKVVMKNRGWLAATVLALALLASACGTAGIEDRGAADPAHADEPEPLNIGVASARVFEHPAQAALDAEYTLTGTIDGVSDGRVDEVTLADGTSERDYYVVVRVKVTEVLRGSPDVFKSGYAYLSRPRGARLYDESGKPIGGDASASVDTISQYLPQGTKVLVMASPASASPEGHGVRTLAPGSVPEGEVTLDFYNAQALLADTSIASPLHGWQGSGFNVDTAVADVRAATVSK